MLTVIITSSIFTSVFQVKAQGDQTSNSTIPKIVEPLNVSKSQIVGPKNLTLIPEKEPPKITLEQMNNSNSSEEDYEIPETPPPLTNRNIGGPPADSETKPPSNSTLNNGNSTIRLTSYSMGNSLLHRVSSGDAHVYVDKYVGSHGTSVVEPSTANKGRLIFYTGNDFTTRSNDGGTKWTYNDPKGDMADFCCDQDVVYDEHRQIFIWYRQAGTDVHGVNYFRLAISRDTLSWWYYDVKPTLFNSAWKPQWWDYPHLALTNDYLFLTSNVFNCIEYMEDGIKKTCPTLPSRAVMAKVSLDDLANVRPIYFLYLEQPFDGHGRRTVTPIQGATDTMYFGTHLSNDHMRIFKWPQSSGTIFPYDVKIPAWKSSERTSMHCAGRDRYNSCNFLDNTILGGWTRAGKVGFLWNVAEGDGFPYPYINVAVFRTSDMAYLERPLVWNWVNAWILGYVSPNDRGLGLVAFWAGGDFNPSVGAAIADNFVSSPPGWQMNWIAGGSNSPATQRLGDYLRIRSVGGECSLWAGTGYVFKGGSGPASDLHTVSDVVYPYYFIIGREIDGTPEMCYNSSYESKIGQNNLSPLENQIIPLNTKELKMVTFPN